MCHCPLSPSVKYTNMLQIYNTNIHSHTLFTHEVQNSKLLEKSQNGLVILYILVSNVKKKPKINLCRPVCFKRTHPLTQSHTKILFSITYILTYFLSFSLSFFYTSANLQVLWAKILLFYIAFYRNFFLKKERKKKKKKGWLAVQLTPLRLTNRQSDFKLLFPTVCESSPQGSTLKQHFAKVTAGLLSRTSILYRLCYKMH